MSITIGPIEIRLGYLQLGNLFALAVSWRTERQYRFEFHRPDAEHSAYYLFWYGLEVVWEFPRTAHCASLAR